MRMRFLSRLRHEAGRAEPANRVAGFPARASNAATSPRRRQGPRRLGVWAAEGLVAKLARSRPFWRRRQVHSSCYGREADAKMDGLAAGCSKGLPPPTLPGLSAPWPAAR